MLARSCIGPSTSIRIQIAAVCHPEAISSPKAESSAASSSVWNAGVVLLGELKDLAFRDVILAEFSVSPISMSS